MGSGKSNTLQFLKVFTFILKLLRVVVPWERHLTHISHLAKIAVYPQSWPNLSKDMKTKPKKCLLG